MPDTDVIFNGTDIIRPQTVVLIDPISGLPYSGATVNVGGAALSTSNPIPIVDAYAAPVVTNWNSSTALNTAVTMSTAGMDCVALTIIPGGTITAGSITFEVFDGYNWFAIKSARESSYNTDSTFNLVGNTQQGWTIPCAAYPQFRFRLSAALTGTSPTATITTIVSSAPDTSVVTVGLDPLQAMHPGGMTQQAAQVLAVGATSVASAVVQANTSRVILSSTTGCWITVGASPTAVANTAGNVYIPPNVPYPLPIVVVPGVSKIAVIQASAGGYLSILESL